MKLTIRINSGNDAVIEPGAEQHISELVNHVARNIKDGSTNGTIRDYNGHTVGEWKYTK